jgi:carbamate kinase
MRAVPAPPPDGATIVIALGGNAISRPGEEGNIAQQFAHTAESVEPIADLIEAGWHPVITHGNGPQIGNILRRVELAMGEVYPLPLHVCVADSQAGMGYMISECLTNALRRRGLSRTAATIITRVVVDPADPAMARPTKPIGRLVPHGQAEEFIRRYGWQMRDFGPAGMRRVVASPRPVKIVEIAAIRALSDTGVTVIAAGGGGIPVAEDAGGTQHGVDCVIDKDRTSALLAAELGAAVLVIATGVERVALDFGTPQERLLDHLTIPEARTHLAAGQFPEGSMGPKIEAAIEFLERSIRPDPAVIITDLARIAQALARETGTRIVRG